MLVRSRELFVGFLLVLALAACGYDSAQNSSNSATTQPLVATVENAQAAAIPTVTEAVPATPTTAPMAQESPTTTVTTTVATTITTTDASAVTETAILPLPSALTTTGEVSTTQVTTAATGTASTSPTEAADPALLAAGLAAYHANYCGVCHTLAKAETTGTFGPPHNGLAAVVAGHLSDGTYQGAAKSPAEYVHESIINPQAYIAPGYATTSHRMPSYAHLDEATLNALVVFLLAP